MELDWPRTIIGAIAFTGFPNCFSVNIYGADNPAGSHHAVIRVYDEAGNVIETQEHIPERIEHF